MGETALLVIDVQVAIMDGVAGKAAAYQRDEVLARIGGLLERARTAGAPVLFAQHEQEDGASGPLLPGVAGWAIHPAVAPRPNEAVIAKRACDAFYETPLDAELARRGVTRLVVAGADSQFCVDTTVRRALSLDYDVVLAADAHTTSGGGPLSPEQTIAHHNATLGVLSHPTREVTVRPAAEIEFR